MFSARNTTKLRQLPRDYRPTLPAFLSDRPVNLCPPPIIHKPCVWAGYISALTCWASQGTAWAVDWPMSRSTLDVFGCDFFTRCAPTNQWDSSCVFFSYFCSRDKTDTKNDPKKYKKSEEKRHKAGSPFARKCDSNTRFKIQIEIRMIERGMAGMPLSSRRYEYLFDV